MIFNMDSNIWFYLNCPYFSSLKNVLLNKALKCYSICSNKIEQIKIGVEFQAWFTPSQRWMPVSLAWYWPRINSFSRWDGSVSQRSLFFKPTCWSPLPSAQPEEKARNDWLRLNNTGCGFSVRLAPALGFV